MRSLGYEVQPPCSVAQGLAMTGRQLDGAGDNVTAAISLSKQPRAHSHIQD